MYYYRTRDRKGIAIWKGKPRYCHITYEWYAGKSGEYLVSFCTSEFERFIGKKDILSPGPKGIMRISKKALVAALLGGKK